MAEQEYTRLTRGHVRTGFAVAVTSRCSLWLGRDHLLFIDSNGYTETYKRFYFRDIQAFTISLTRNRLVWNWILGSLASLCVIAWIADILSSSPTTSTGGIITGIVVTLLFSIPLLLNNLLGPTCTCQIKTAVQTEELPPLNRLRRARRVLTRLRPLISAAQTRPATEAVPSQAVEAVASAEMPVVPAIITAEAGIDPMPPPQGAS